MIPYNCLKSSCFRYIHRVYLPGQQYLNPIKTLFTRIFLFCSTVSFLFIRERERGDNTIGTYIYMYTIYREFSSFDSSMRANVSPLFVPKRTETKRRERERGRGRREERKEKKIQNCPDFASLSGRYLGSTSSGARGSAVDFRHGYDL